MRAMVLQAPQHELIATDLPTPEVGPDDVLVKVRSCGVCRTDLHIVDGELDRPKLPLVPGHEIVGEIIDIGRDVTGLRRGERVGIPWLGWTCGDCTFCRSGHENLCEVARFTGYQIDGGYAEVARADHRYCFPLSGDYDDVAAAPLLCAGLIGYRALRMAGEGRRLGIYGFGAAAHIVVQVARHQGRDVYAFTRPGDRDAQDFARELGAVWAGPSDAGAPEPLDAALIFAPVGALVPAALRAMAKGGRVVCAGIHMSDIPAFPYSILWQERSVCSVANLTRRDAIEFLELAPRARVRTETQAFPLAEANRALRVLREGRLRGAAVLVP